MEESEALRRNGKSIEWSFPFNFRRLFGLCYDAQSSIFHLNEIKFKFKSTVI